MLGELVRRCPNVGTSRNKIFLLQNRFLESISLHIAAKLHKWEVSTVWLVTTVIMYNSSCSYHSVYSGEFAKRFVLLAGSISPDHWARTTFWQIWNPWGLRYWLLASSAWSYSADFWWNGLSCAVRVWKLQCWSLLVMNTAYNCLLHQLGHCAKSVCMKRNSLFRILHEVP